MAHVHQNKVSSGTYKYLVNLFNEIISKLFKLNLLALSYYYLTKTSQGLLD